MKHEVQNGIALHAGNKRLNDASKLSEHVFDLCKPLIEDGPKGTVIFVHFSVKEYVNLSIYSTNALLTSVGIFSISLLSHSSSIPQRITKLLSLASFL